MAKNAQHDNLIDLAGLTVPEIEQFAGELGLESFRGRQISRWVFQKHVSDIALMTDLSKGLREGLARAARVSGLEPARMDRSKDGSKKYLFATSDGLGIESVLIPEAGHLTLCLSTQLGCTMGCTFCHTGSNGLVRNLTAAEIINQVRAIMPRESFGAAAPNIVFMGMGEPLANYDRLIQAIRIMLHPDGCNFSHRRITVSTAGLVPRIRKLGEDVPVNLAISLNAPNDRIRSALMPINKKYPLSELLEAARDFPKASRKRITFEYILIKGINDAPVHARELAALLKGMPCKINLIPYNEHAASGFNKPDECSIVAFQQILHDRNYTAPIRRSKGSDIAAACGQLGLRHKE